MTKTEMVNQIIEAPSACAELKQAATDYLNAVGTDKEKELGAVLVAEAEEDLMTNESTAMFFSSDKAKEIFGEEKANQILAHCKQLIADGVKYCDCPGCTAAKQIVDNKELFL